MAEIQLTQAQQAAVDNRGGSLLVSAAAGSGKTKVLVERLFAYMERETMKIRLEPVTVASRAAVERLETAPGQEGFVESVAECLAEADRRRCWRPVGVYDGMPS